MKWLHLQYACIVEKGLAVTNTGNESDMWTNIPPADLFDDLHTTAINSCELLRQSCKGMLGGLCQQDTKNEMG
jgi:hypothetical protein